VRPRRLRACLGCSGRASRAVSRPGDCGGPPRAVRQRLSPARSRRPPRASARPLWPGCWRWGWPRCCSTLVAGCAWPPAAASGRGLKTRCVTRSTGLRRKGGGCGTRSNVAGGGISTASRLHRPESGSRSRPKRARSMRATWPTPGRRPRGFTGVAGAGVGEERSRCCAWCVPAGWRGSRTGFLWSRLIAWFRLSGPAREPRRGPGSWLRSLRPAEREALLGSLAAWSGVGGVREHGGEQEVREAVGDRLGHRRCVAVQCADGQRREPAGLLGMLDQRRRLGGWRGVP